MQEVVDRPRLAEQQEPAHSVEQVRNAKRNDHAKKDMIAAGRVGPLDDKRLDQSERDRHYRGTGGVNERVPEAPGEERAGEKLRVKLQCQLVKRQIRAARVHARI